MFDISTSRDYTYNYSIPTRISVQSINYYSLKWFHR